MCVGHATVAAIIFEVFSKMATTTQLTEIMAAITQSKYTTAKRMEKIKRKTREFCEQLNCAWI